MQKKKLNKILIAAVALIWGVVLFKFASPYFTPSETVITADVLVQPKNTFTQKKDTFDLQLPERDPFLGKTYRTKKAVTNTVTKSKKKTTVKKKTTLKKSWPRIEYLGFVKSSKNKSRLGLVRINGVLKRLRQDDHFREVQVVSISEEQITLSFQNEKKEFNK